jgi:hypothetical protein
MPVPETVIASPSNVLVVHEPPVPPVPPLPPDPVAHTPALHALAPQLTPQAPQLAGSESTPTQRSPQSVSCAPHAHAPFAQVCPDAQGRSQPPQWATLVVVLMQSVPHCSRPLAHDAWHCPSEQTLPAAQALPQLPQFAALD